MLNNNRERKWRVSVRLDKRSERFGVRKETVGGKSGSVSAKSQPQARGLQHRVYTLGLEINANSSKRSEEGRDHLSLKLGDPAIKMAVCSICKATIRKGYTLLWSRPRKNGE